MDPSESGAFAALGEDLFLLSIRPRDGKLMTWGRIDLGLMGSELVRLAAAGRAGIDEGRIAVLDPTATGDPELDAALVSLIDSGLAPRPEPWVGLPRRGIRDAYAARLVSAGVLRAKPGRIIGASRYVILDSSRVAAARSRLDAITQSSGRPADSAQAALGGLACAIGLGGVLYPGRPGRDRRARMAEIARQEVMAHTAISTGRVPPAGPPGGASEPPREAAADLPRDATAAAVHAVTAVVESGAVISSPAPGTHGPGDHGTSHDGGDGHHDGARGDRGRIGGFRLR
jgi:Golgi phosphoprotein 3 (GPP34)